MAPHSDLPIPSMVDTHCHLDLIMQALPGKSLEMLLEEAAAVGVTRCISVGLEIEQSRYLLESLTAHPSLSVSAGIHPSSVAKACEKWGEIALKKALHELISDPRCIALGETGLDFTPETTDKEKALQIQWFEQHLLYASEVKKPLIIHCRNAFETCFSILKAYNRLPNLIFHCFTGNRSQAMEAIDLGAWCSLSGILTFKSAESLREAVQAMPPEKLLLETDAPYLAPVPFRSRINAPSLLPHTAKQLASLKKLSIAEIAHLTTRNAHEAFPLLAP